MEMEGAGVMGSLLSLFQDYIFYLEPEKLESGKGECSYDPKVDSVSALISESFSLATAALQGGQGDRGCSGWALWCSRGTPSWFSALIPGP